MLYELRQAEAKSGEAIKNLPTLSELRNNRIKDRQGKNMMDCCYKMTTIQGIRGSSEQREENSNAEE
jgi:hypothetical protein